MGSLARRSIIHFLVLHSKMRKKRSSNVFKHVLLFFVFFSSEFRLFFQKHLKKYSETIIYPHPNDIGFYSFHANFTIFMHANQKKWERNMNYKPRHCNCITKLLLFPHFKMGYFIFERLQESYLFVCCRRRRHHHHHRRNHSTTISREIKSHANCVLNFHSKNLDKIRKQNLLKNQHSKLFLMK